MVDVFSLIQFVANIFVPDDKQCSPCDVSTLKSFKCDCTSTTINCENRRIKTLPTLDDNCLFSGITEINFANNEITFIQSDAFKGLQVKNSGKGGVNHLKLDLSNNHITSIDEKSLLNLAKFTSIDLSNNNLRSSSFKGDYAKLKSLKELDLGHNALDSMPAEFCQLPQLQTMQVDGNPGRVFRDTSRWRSLPEEFWEQNCNASSKHFPTIPILTLTFSLVVHCCCF